MTVKIYEGPQGQENIESDGPGKTLQSLTFFTAIAPSLGVQIASASIGGNLNVAGAFTLASVAGFQGITVAGQASISTLLMTGAASFAAAVVDTSTMLIGGATSIGGTTQVPAFLATGTASVNALFATAASTFAAALSVASISTVQTIQVAQHLQSFGPVVNATNGAASAAMDTAIGNDLAGRIFFRSTAAGGGAQIIHVFSQAFPTNPYPLINGAGNASFQAGFPTVAVSANSMTVSLTLAPAVGASLSYFFHLTG